MRWWWLSLLVGCAVASPSSLRVDLVSGQIVFQRSPDHTFGTLSATANGVDCDPPTILAGSQGSQFYDPSTDATAWFPLPPMSLDNVDALHVVVVEDGGRYAMDVATLAAPRAVTFVTPLNQPVRAGDWVQLMMTLDIGVAPLVPTTTCTGTSLTCNGVALPAVSTSVAVTLAT